jgi:hypothetical protein
LEEEEEEEEDDDCSIKIYNSTKANTLPVVAFETGR